MNTPIMKLTTAAVCLAFATCASAGALMSKRDYQASKKRISADAKEATAACKSFVSNAKDICVAEANGKEKIALAELEEAYKPSDKTRYETRVAHAKATHAVAKEKCDDATGNTKDVCVKQADAAQTQAMADAKAKMKTSEAKGAAQGKIVNAKGEADKTITDARNDATAEKRAAQYGVAKEKCDAFVADAKDSCLKDAKAKYGKI